MGDSNMSKVKAIVKRMSEKCEEGLSDDRLPKHHFGGPALANGEQEHDSEQQERNDTRTSICKKSSTAMICSTGVVVSCKQCGSRRKKKFAILSEAISGANTTSAMI